MKAIPSTQYSVRNTVKIQSRIVSNFDSRRCLGGRSERRRIQIPGSCIHSVNTADVYSVLSAVLRAALEELTVGVGVGVGGGTEQKPTTGGHGGEC